MSQKEQVEEMLKAGKGYDEIEDQTGSARSYIRSIAVGYRKRKGEDKPPEPEEGEPKTLKPKEKEEDRPAGMNFYDDDPKPKEKESNHKSGMEHHKAWVKAAKYECGSCGATIGKSESFCPHCGQTLIWEGVE